MPRVTVEILEGRSLEQKKKIGKEVAAAVEESFNLPAAAAAVRIIEVSFEDFAANGELRCDTSAREGKKVYGRGLEPRIIIQAIEGRTMEVRKKAAARITEQMSQILGVDKNDVAIQFIDQPKNEFAAGGKLVCDN